MAKSAQERVSEVFGHFGVHIESLPMGDPLRQVGAQVGDRITAVVGSLATVFPNEVINRLMRDVWHLLGSRTVFVALHPAAVAPTVIVLGIKNGEPEVAILFPSNWIESASADMVMAGGALIFCGSQAIDGFNQCLFGSQFAPIAKKRARAHEAEYLLAVHAASPQWVPNEYQQGVLADFPEGVKSAKELLYVGRPVPLGPVSPVGD